MSLVDFIMSEEYEKKLYSPSEMALLRDLRENGPQCSWDWDADLRFARIVGDTEAEEALQEICRSSSLTVIREAAHLKFAAHIKKERIRILRMLPKDGRARASWHGTGEGGLREFGASRFRCWEATGRWWKK